MPADGGAATSALLERELELEQLAHRIDAAISGDGSVVAVEGQAGIGKSALVAGPTGPRNFGLALISLGVWALAIACLQYWREMRRFDPGRTPFSLTLAVAGFVALFGILALMDLLFHIGPF